MVEKIPAEVRRGAPAVARAMDILGLLAERPSALLTLTEIAKELGVPKSSTANLCAVLQAADMIRRIHGGYCLGYKVVELGGRYLSSVDTVADFYDGVATSSALSSETARLAALDGTDVVYLACADGNQPLRIRTEIGERLPASCTATGKAMLARFDDQMVRARYAGIRRLPTLTSRAAGTVSELVHMLGDIRRQGYAMDEQETAEGITCIGVAFEATHESWMAASATVLSARWTVQLKDDLLDDLRALSGRLSLRMRPRPIPVRPDDLDADPDSTEHLIRESSQPIC